MEEMLRNISPTEKHKFQLKSWLSNFSKFLKGIPADEEKISLLEYTSALSAAVRPPMALPALETTFMFEPPTSATFVGSYNTGTLIRVHDMTVVDLMVVMPKVSCRCCV